MLSRVAENLFWIARYVERAENIARLVDAARRMTALPRTLSGPHSNEWSSILIAAGARASFEGDIEAADSRAAIHHLIFAPENPSSVYNAFRAARENGRAIRSALTQETWEALNDAWTGIRDAPGLRGAGAALADRIDSIKAKSALFRGAIFGTMLRDDGYEFLQLGMAIERVDSTARLLDVKYHVLLPNLAEVGSGADHYQWQSLLQASAAQRSYAFVTKSEISAKGVAEFLILTERFPRSILYNVQRLSQKISDLEAYYGKPAACHDLVADFAQRLAKQDVDSIFAYGLHEFLTDTIEHNYAVASGLAQTYGFAPMLTGDGASDDSNEQ
jgi:uncharacterized alpha-E superfamily protein